MKIALVFPKYAIIAVKKLKHFKQEIIVNERKNKCRVWAFPGAPTSLVLEHLPGYGRCDQWLCFDVIFCLSFYMKNPNF